MKYLTLNHPGDARQILDLFPVTDAVAQEIAAAVQKILAAVRREGDAACLRFTREFDGVALTKDTLEVTPAERHSAGEHVTSELHQALIKAAGNIHFYHEQQKPRSWRVERPGVVLEERVTPVARVGMYIPGGRAKYPSTVLMTAIPAKIAGVDELIMVSPPDHHSGAIDPALLVAAEIAGVDRVFRLGGAQAIAALAFGTETIPAVDKIVGPGNAYVAEAKRQVFGHVGIDLLAGPTEIALLVDDSVPALVVVRDLFAQMEHDPMTRALVVSRDPDFLQKVAQLVEQEFERAPRAEVLRQAWQHHTCFAACRDEATACAAINAFAPEHLQIMTAAPRAWLPQIQHAGAIFLGPYSPVALGDYVAGPNHTLPTNRSARFASPLGVYDFIRHQHVIEYTREGWGMDKEVATELARAEQLFNHALSVRARGE